MKIISDLVYSVALIVLGLMCFVMAHVQHDGGYATAGAVLWLTSVMVMKD